MLQHYWHQQIALFDAVALLTFDQPLRAAKPPGRAANLSSECEIDAHPERAAHSAQSFAGIQVHVMGTLQAAYVIVVAAEHVGRCCEQLEIPRS
jgi:hypothetical protein